MSYPTYDLTLQRALERQAAFSRRAFGSGKRTGGICEHIHEECLEVIDSDHSVEECVDVLILALDLCWRSGATPEEVERALCAKMTKNERRKWPPVGSVGEDQKINHIKADTSPGHWEGDRWVVNSDWVEGAK